AITICPPTPTGAEPQVPTTVARATRPSASSQLRAASSTSWALARWRVVGGSDMGLPLSCLALLGRCRRRPAADKPDRNASGTGGVRRCRCSNRYIRPGRASRAPPEPGAVASGARQARIEELEDGLARGHRRAVVDGVNGLVGLLRRV